ncbi:hypothetical protein D3C79_1045530 [compost metagenome]
MGADVIGVRVQLRVRHDQHFRPGHLQQRTQVSQQVVPGWRAIAVGRQPQRVEATERADIGHVGFSGNGRHIGRCLHGGQLQAEVA